MQRNGECEIQSYNKLVIPSGYLEIDEIYGVLRRGELVILTGDRRIVLAGKWSRDIVKLLLDGSAPLHYAATGGNYAIARVLRLGGADSNLRNLDGETPLILAARKGHNDMTALLIENGADVNLVDNLQQSALHYAAENGFTEIVEQLLIAGAEG